MYFRDRSDAGQKLIRLVNQYRQERPLVIGIPNGGVATAAPVAAGLGAPLDIWAASRISAPEQPELGLGAVAEGGFVHLDPNTGHWRGATQAQIDVSLTVKQTQVAQAAARLRGGARPPDVAGRTVLVVDDGVANGVTARAVLQAIRAAGPRRLVLVTPVGAISTLADLRNIAHSVHALEETRNLVAVGAWYLDFTRVSDEEVISLLAAARPGGQRAPPSSTERLPTNHREVDLRVDGVTITGSLSIPPGANGLVISASASGSGRFSPRNRYLAAELRSRGLATLLFDLLTHREELRDFEHGELRFDIELLTRRLVAVTDWATQSPATRLLRIGYVGGGTAAAAQITAAARKPHTVRAAVARGGRPDLAHKALSQLMTPTLLIASPGDGSRRIEQARRSLAHESELQFVPSPSQLFEEPGALERVCELAGNWFDRWLVQAPRLPGARAAG